MKILKMLLAALLLLTPSIGVAQSNGFWTDRAVGVSQFNGFNGLVPLSYAQVRVCTYPAVNSPCTPLANVFDVTGSPLTVQGGNFGQVSTDVVGRFSFQAAPGSYVIQVAATGSNTPQLNYPITISNTGTVSTVLSALSIQSLNSARLFADRYTGADWCAQVQAAHDAAPTGGATIDASGLSGTTPCTSANITLTKPVTVSLGVGTYALGTKQILTNADGITIQGMGQENTILTFTGTSSKAIFGSRGAQTEVKSLTLRDFSLDGSGSTTSNGIEEVTPTRHLYTHIYVKGFQNNIKLDGSQNYGTLNVLDKVTSRNCGSTALWLFGNADLAPIFSGRVIANTTVTGGDFHCSNGGTSIQLDSVGVAYINSNLIENGTTGTGTGVAVNASSVTSFSQDVKLVGNDFEGLATGTSITANSTRTTLLANDYFSVTNHLTSSGTATTFCDLTGTATDLCQWARGLDINPQGTSTASRIVIDDLASTARITLYTPTGGSTWFPFGIRNNAGNFQILRADATATIGTLTNYNAVFQITPLGAFTFADNTGTTQGTISSAGVATFKQLVSNIATGTAPIVVTSTTPVPTLLVSNHPIVSDCGTTTTCSNTSRTNARVIMGVVTLSAGAASITGISPAFTSVATYVCTATDATAIAAVRATNVSSSAFNIAGTTTDVIVYTCVGY